MIRLLRAHFENPGYSCRKCLEMFEECGGKGAWMPDCTDPAIGCRIGEDIARDRKARRVMNYFLLAKHSPGAQSSERIFNSLLERAGLLDDLDLFLELEAIYYEFATEKQKQREALHKGRR